ncbi:testis-specific Y-encoded-like protein 2 isoform X1 [Myotis lucifugus]|uniref:testis-specific Y-encoded-like protein 2 isoform X1 n=1 Tax=Myotis lucifugus TaxID=59463 RepID=UPI0003C47E1F|nr:testis-specific Y-encoded-like protein 2 isoform X1 [Myotis lucifugus]
MDRPDEGPPAKARRLSSSEPSQDDAPPPPPPPPPPPLMRLPLPPPEQRPRLREETEAAQVLADMRGVGLGPTLPPPPPYVILEEGGVRAYFTLGAGCSYWDPEFESGYGEAPPPAESLETFSPEEVAGGSLEIDIQVTEPEPEPEPEPSGFSGEAIDTCSIGGREYQVLAGLQGKEEAIIIVEDDEEEVKENVRKKRRRRRRKQRKVKKQNREVNPEKIQYVLQALESIQLDLEAVNIKAGKAFLRLKRKFIQMRRPFLERRDLIIQHIPGFWVKAFLNHPKISVLISPRDEDIFRYLTNLQVQDLRHISMGYKMKLYFKTNPYFTNMVIVKEFQCNRSGRLVSHSTPIRWHRGQEPQAHKERNQDYSFFSWFSNHSLPEADRIAEIIKNDLWVNPVRYYMMGEGGYRANRKKQEKKERFSHIKKKNRYELVIMDDFDDYQLMQDIIGETSDSDFITDNETVHDIKISDFMETTDCFETTDNEITDFSESFCDSESVYDCESPDRHLTTENNDSADEHTYGGENSKGGGCGNNLDSSDSDYGDNETSDDEDNDGNEGDNEGSDDDGNEGDNEGSDDDDRDIDYYENAIAEPQKNQLKISNLGYYEDEVENIFEEESSMEEEDEEGSEEEDEDSDDEEGSEEEEEDEEEEGIEEDWEDSDVEEVLQVQNAWANPRKRGKTG